MRHDTHALDRRADARAVRSLTATQEQELERELRAEHARAQRAMATDDRSGESRTVARYELIADALRRIDEGMYGRCAACGEPIPYGRLTAMPETTRCIAC